MDLNSIKYTLKSSPAFIIDQSQINKNLLNLSHLKKQAGCKVLYSVKALPLEAVMQQVVEHLDGFSVSSLYEAKLASKMLGKGRLHITTPGLRDGEFDEVSQLCSHVSFNSYSQYQRLNKRANQACSLGIRVNPKHSFSDDVRFDPCRQYSKLGLDITLFDTVAEAIEGVHLHTVFSSMSYQPLRETLCFLKDQLGYQLNQLQWINLGGGYLHSQIQHQQPFINEVQQLKKDYGLEVYIEPGKDVVGNAGYLMSTVIDHFYSDGKAIAVLDTSVNHNPEVFEYQKSPTLLDADPNGTERCLLVGSSCLAGDILGEYSFKSQPKLGDRLVFSNVGAYSLIKANRFNGYNFPAIYLMDSKNIRLIKQYTYQDYQQQWVNE